jgi:hypothetical protein
MANPSEDALRDMLHEDCEFLSPVVFTPQKGRDLTMMYLLSAGQVFKDTQFRYTSELIGDNRMVLEFESEMDGKYLNGVDIIDFNDDGKITRFKVMVRPLQAVNMLWEHMGAMLEKMKSA